MRTGRTGTQSAPQPANGCRVPSAGEPSTTGALRIVQLNMQGARAVSHELSNHLREECVDLDLVQEPYSGPSGDLVGLGLAIRKAVAQKCGSPGAAALAYSGRTSVTQLEHLSNGDDHFKRNII